jgi:hypothetical protein
MLKLKKIEYLIALTGYFLVALFILNRILFFSPGTVGFFHDWPIGPYPEMTRTYANGGFYVWDSQIGNKLYYTDWIFRLSLIPFSFLDGEVLSKGLLLLTITLSGFGAFCLGKQLKLSPYSSFAAGILYIFSPIVFTRIVAGYIYYLIAYFLSPFIVALFLKGKEEGKKKEKEQEKKGAKNQNFKYFITAGILTSFAAIQLQFLVMIFIVLLVFSIIDFGRIKKSVLGLVVVFSIAALINLSPIILSDTLYSKVSDSPFSPAKLLSSYNEIEAAPNLIKGLRLLGYESHPYGYTKIGTSEDPLFGSDIKEIGHNKTNLVSNPDFIFVAGNNNNSQSKLPKNWIDPFRNCNIIFKCTVVKSKETTGWQNSTSSFQVSTNLTKKDTWSYVPGNEIAVKPGEQYGIITHMKLNEFATQSHIAIEGYNTTSNKWNQLKPQCPSGTDGPLDWHEFSCDITSIPKDTSKIRPVLNAGWSSEKGKEAVTLFDAIAISKLSDTSVIIPSWIFYLDFVLPIAGFSSLIFYRQDKYTLSFAIISIIGLFLLKGPNPPLQDIFNFIFTHGFYIFREIWHIAFLYGFSISFLIAFFLERIVTRTLSLPKLKYYSSVYEQRHQHHHPFYSLVYSALFLFLSYNKLKNYHKIILCSFLVSLIVISNGYPLLIGNFGGYLQTYDFPKEYHTVYSSVLTNNTFNTLMLPLFAPIQYKGLKLAGVDPLITYSSTNIFNQFSYDDPSFPTTGLITWLHSVMQENKTNNLGKLLSGFGIKYIILRKDFISIYPDYVSLGDYGPFRERWFSSLEPFLDIQKDLTVISDTSHYKIYENVNNAKKIFAPTIVANALSDYRTLLYISNFTSLSNTAAYTSDYNNNFTKVDNQKIENVSSYDFTELGKYTTSYDPTSDWTTNRDWFGYDYLLASRIHVGAFSMAHNSTFSFDLSPPQKYQNKSIEVWMRALTWPKGKMVSISVNGKQSLYSLFSEHSKFPLIKIFDGKSTGAPYHFLITNIIGSNYIEGIYIREKSMGGDINNIFIDGNKNKTNLVSNPDFIIVSRDTININNNINQSRLPINWSDPFKNCNIIFKCTGVKSKTTPTNNKNTAGWQNSTSSFQVSTNVTNKNTWSLIYGNEINVNPGESYAFVTHMKLNQFARGSHIAIDGFNYTTNKWNQLKPQCPAGTNGPLNWHEFSCEIIIPKNTSKIRPVLNAGWSSEKGKEAVTLFGPINISKINDINDYQNIANGLTLKKVISNLHPLLISKYTNPNPTLWQVHMNDVEKPFVIGFAEPYDSSWEAIVYKDGKKVDVAKPGPLYSGINGFQINQTGNLDIVLRYKPQDLFEIGLIISGVALTISLFYLFYDWRNGKGDKWVEKISRMKNI